MRIAAPVLHPSPDSAPAPAAAAAVNAARQIGSVAVGIGGDLGWAEGFGYADIKSGALVTPVRRFRIGTASPVLTSAAAGLLLQDGRLELNEQIQACVPAVPKKQCRSRCAR